MITSIKWIVYDGTAMTRPHSIRKRFFYAGPRQRVKLEKCYILCRAGYANVETQAFTLQAGKRISLSGWIWESVYPDGSEEAIEYPLTIGDAWAEWPLLPQPEAQP